MASGGSNKLLTPDQVAELLAVTRRTLMDRYRSWELPYVRVGKHIRFRERDVQAWVDKRLRRV